VMRGKQHLVAIRPDRQVLTLETMYFADEVRDPATELDTLPSTELEFTGRELDTAKLLIEAMAADWDPAQYRDTYRDAVEELVDRKSRGEVVTSERPAEPAAPVVDLMEALRASVEQAREGRAAAKPPAKPRAAVRKTAAKPATKQRARTAKVAEAEVGAEAATEAEAERKSARRKAS